MTTRYPSSSLSTTDRSLLGEPSGRLPTVLLDDIDEGIRLILGL